MFCAPFLIVLRFVIDLGQFIMQLFQQPAQVQYSGLNTLSIRSFDLIEYEINRLGGVRSKKVVDYKQFMKRLQKRL